MAQDHVEIQASSTPWVFAYRVDESDPSKGYTISVGYSEGVVLTPEQADELGRFLLFDDAEKTDEQ